MRQDKTEKISRPFLGASDGSTGRRKRYLESTEIAEIAFALFRARNWRHEVAQQVDSKR
jgi:hypothetical protein